MPIRSVGSEFRVNSTNKGNQWETAVDSIGDGRFLVTWHSDDQMPDDFEGLPYTEGQVIRGRIFDSNGAVIGNDFIVNETLDLPNIPDAYILDNGDVLLSWETGSAIDDPWPINLHGRVFDTNGAPKSEQFDIDDESSWALSAPLLKLNSGRFLATWSNWDEVRARLIGTDGRPLGDSFVVNRLDTGNEVNPASLQLPNGNILVAWLSDIDLWEETPVDPDGVSVMARILRPDGRPLGGDFNLNQNPTLAEWLQFDLKLNTDETVLVTWRESYQADISEPRTGRLLNAQGTPIGNEFPVVPDRSLHEGVDFPERTLLADGRTLLTWNVPIESETLIKAIMLDKNDRSISDVFTIDAPEYSSLDSLPDGKLLATWYSGGYYLLGEGNYEPGDVFAQIFNPKIFDGTDGDDFWTGGAFNDRLNGGDGNDRLRGMEGEDRLRGGNGNDFLDGSEGDDFLWGDAGNDILAGWTGIDRMTGGTGNDTYVVDRLEDIVLELAGEGIDTVQSYISLRLGANVEHLVLKGRGDTTGSGNALANSIVGNSGDNRLSGGNGNDRLVGGKGADVLVGGAGRDRLYGDDGPDRLYSGHGRDLLFGGPGNDRFVFRSIAEAGTGAQRDSMGDFRRGEDLIDLRRIDADITHGGNQAFHFLGPHRFSGDAGELRFVGSVLAGDVNGDGLSDFQITVTGVAGLGTADILL